MPQTELNVVCKKCGSEVSPYVTECPYCGTRLRKRAPKIGQLGETQAKQQPKRTRSFSMPGVSGNVLRPYVTIAFVLISVLASLLWRSELYALTELAMAGPVGDEYWRFVTASFVYENVGYEFICLVSIAVFGWLIERRHGPVVTVLLILSASVAGYGGAYLIDQQIYALGGNAVALALLGTWVVPDLFARLKKEETDSDMLAVLTALIALLLVPVATEQASEIVGVLGLAFGLLTGLLLLTTRTLFSRGS